MFLYDPEDPNNCISIRPLNPPSLLKIVRVIDENSKVIEFGNTINANEKYTYIASKNDIDKLKWCFWIDNRDDVFETDYTIEIKATEEKEDSAIDFFLTSKAEGDNEKKKENTEALQKNAVLLATVGTEKHTMKKGDKAKDVTVLKVKFSKWLDGEKVCVEVYDKEPTLDISKDVVLSSIIVSNIETGIDLSDLKNGDPYGASQLVKDLQNFTGLASLHINKGGFLDYDRSYWGGKLRGFNKIKNPSATARRELIRALKSKNTIQVLNNYDGIGGQGHRSATLPGTNIIYFNSESVKGIISNPSQGFKLNPKKMITLGYAMTLLHELMHTVTMGELTDKPRYEGDVIGAVEAKMNLIRTEMNLPLASPYGTVGFPLEILIEGNRVNIAQDFMGFDPITSKILNEYKYGTYPEDGSDRFFFNVPNKYTTLDF